ncbi:MAG: type II toxin-antitoxin system PemK/MazF family toxin [Bryobacteraceae bacterium]
MPHRGEIWWVRLDPSLGSEIRKTRPCLVMSTDIVNERRRTVIVLPLSTSPGPSPPLLISVQCAGRPVVAVVDQLRAVAKERLGALVGVASAEEMAAIEDGLRQILEL